MSLRRLSSAFRGTDALATDSDTDFQLRSLYPDFAILEKKCDISLKENNFLQNLKSPEKKSIVGSSTFSAIHYEKDPDEVVEQLPPEYFLKEFDPVQGHLEEISSWVDDDITERFMQKIEDTDTDKDVILGHLTTMIDSNYDELMMCMSKIQDIDTNLIQAGLQSNYGRKRIKAAQDMYTSGPMQIVWKAQKKKKLETIMETIRNLKGIKDVHKSMMSRLNLGDLGDAAQQAMTVLDHLKRHNFDQFNAMKGIGNSMQKTVLSIRRKSDKALKRLCSRKFTVLEYENIIKAYLHLDNIEQTYKIKQVEPGYLEDDIVFDTAGGIDGLAQRVGRFQLEDVESSLHQAVVEHIFLDQQKKHHHNNLSKYNMQSHNAGEDLDEVPLAILLRRLSAEHIPLCIVRSCELLADIVHTHFCISQWHAAPFDPQNHSVTFLHRDISNKNLTNNIYNNDTIDQRYEDDSEDEDDEVEVFASHVHHRDQPATETNSNNDAHTTRFNYAKLAIAWQSMRQSRGFIWDELLQGLARLLRATSFSSEIKLDDFCAMSWALHVMVLLGKEYCGSDSETLVRCLEEKSEEYFRNFHMENFTVVRMMIDAELWNHIPLQLQTINQNNNNNNNTNGSSILAAIKHSFGARKSASLTSPNGHVEAENDSESEESSILSSFAVAGNPLKFVLRSEQENDLSAPQDTPPSDSDSEENEDAVTAAAITTPRAVRQALRRWDSDDFLDEHVATKNSSNSNTISKKKDADRSSFLITQTAFNGLGKSLAKYLQMMRLIPSAAMDVFDALTELLDFYLCAVFYGFVPAEERLKFFGVPNKMTSMAPDHRRDYEILKDYLAKSFNEVVFVPKGLVDPTTSMSPFTFMNSSNNNNHNDDSPVNTNNSTMSSVSSDPSNANINNNNNSINSSNVSNDNLFGFTNNNNNNNNNSNNGYLHQRCPTAAYDSVHLSQLLKIPTIIEDTTTNSIENCFALNQRIVAAESCWFVAQMLQDAKVLLMRLVNSDNNNNANFEKITSYISNFSLVIGQLRALLYKINGPLLIDYSKTLSVIVDCGWESKKLNADHHEWVDDLIDNCQRVWDYMMLTDQFAEASSLVREQVWMELCSAAFEVTLEAYSKVKKCTPEGRAGMIMDVFALHDGLNNIHLCRCPRGKHYVDSYLQAFCLNEEDLMVWIQENYQTYAYRHIYGMLQQTLSSMLNNKKLRDAVAVIDQLYETDDSSLTSNSNNSNSSITGSGIGNGAVVNKLSNMISSSLIAGKFRK